MLISRGSVLATSLCLETNPELSERLVRVVFRLLQCGIESSRNARKRTLDWNCPIGVDAQYETIAIQKETRCESGLRKTLSATGQTLHSNIRECRNARSDPVRILAQVAYTRRQRATRAEADGVGPPMQAASVFPKDLVHKSVHMGISK